MPKTVLNLIPYLHNDGRGCEHGKNGKPKIRRVIAAVTTHSCFARVPLPKARGSNNPARRQYHGWCACIIRDTLVGNGFIIICIGRYTLVSLKGCTRFLDRRGGVHV